MTGSEKMNYIQTIKNGDTVYSVFSKKKASGGTIVTSYGICAENSSDAVYVPDITTVPEIALCMMRVFSSDRIAPGRIEESVKILTN